VRIATPFDAQGYLWPTGGRQTFPASTGVFSLIKRINIIIISSH